MLRGGTGRARFGRGVGGNRTPVATAIFDFLAGETLDPRITFSRTTHAMDFDSTGKLTFAPNNVLVRSEEFDSASWTKSETTVTAGTGTAGDKLVTTNATSGSNGMRVTQACTAVGNETAAIYSVYAKAAELSWMFLGVFSTGTGSFVGGRNFNLASGTLGANAATGTLVTNCGIVAAPEVGAGWYRCWIRGNFGTGTHEVQINLLGSDATTRTVTGNGTDGLFAYGAQLERVTYETSPRPYLPTTTTAYYGPRFDYDPVTLAPRGLLIEEQRTNLLTFSEQFDNAAWVKSSLTVTANNVVAPDGLTSAETVTDSLDASASVHSLQNTITWTAGIAYTVSFYAKQGTLPGCLILFPSAAFTANSTARFRLDTGVVAFTDTGVTATITSVGNGWYRCSATATATTSSSAAVQLRTATTIASFYQGTGTGTVQLWGAQLEAGSFATSYIPTTTAAATRAADVATMQGANFSNWYRQDEGSVFAEYSASNGGRALMFDDGSTANRFEIRFASGTSQLSSWSGNVQVVTGLFAPGATGLPERVTLKAAAGLRLDDAACTANGFMPGVDTSCAMPIGLNRAFLGSFQGTATFINGHIRRIAYYNTRLSDTDLARITA